MKAELGNLERITLAGLLPKEENYLTFKMITKLKADLSFSEKEHKQYKIQVLPGNRVGWESNGVKMIEIPDTIKDMVCEKLKTIESEKKLNDDNLSLYELLILNIPLKVK